jgi:hypothetical protein
MRHPASHTITFNEVDRILYDALNRAKEVHCKERKDGWIASTHPIDGLRPIKSSPGVQTAIMKELAKAAERYSDFLIYGKIPNDLKANRRVFYLKMPER